MDDDLRSGRSHDTMTAMANHALSLGALGVATRVL
jgi:hypothetical protein